MAYNLYKFHLRKCAQEINLVLRDERIGFIFFFPLPIKMSRKERRLKHLTPHGLRPDADNLDKAVKDALRVKNGYLPDDSSIYNYAISKYWIDAPAGFIDVYFMKESWDAEIMKFMRGTLQ